MEATHHEEIDTDADMQEQEAELCKTIETIQEEIRRLEEEQEDLKREIKENEREIEEKSTAANELRHKMSQLTIINDRIVIYRSIILERTDNLENLIADIEQKLSVIEAKSKVMAKLCQQKLDIHNNFIAHNEYCTTMSSVLNKKRCDMEDLLQSITEKRKVLLASKGVGKKGEYLQTKQRLKECIQNYEKAIWLKKHNRLLREEIQQLKNKCDAKDIDIRSLEQKIIELNAEIEEASNRPALNEMKGKIEFYESEKKNLKHKINEMRNVQKEIEDIQRKYEKKENGIYTELEQGILATFTEMISAIDNISNSYSMMLNGERFQNIRSELCSDKKQNLENKYHESEKLLIEMKLESENLKDAIETEKKRREDINHAYNHLYKSIKASIKLKRKKDTEVEGTTKKCAMDMETQDFNEKL